MAFAVLTLDYSTVGNFFSYVSCLTKVSDRVRDKVSFSQLQFEPRCVPNLQSSELGQRLPLCFDT
jgi:hypothetical protein